MEPPMEHRICEPCKEWITRYFSDQYEIGQSDDGSEHLGSIRLANRKPFKVTEYRWNTTPISHCYLCHHFNLQFLSTKSRNVPEKGHLSLTTRPHGCHSMNVMSLQHNDAFRPEVYTPDIRFFNFTFAIKPDECRTFPSRIWSPETVAYARKWVKECRGGHCRPSHEHEDREKSLFLPPRLVHVTRDGGVLQAALHETKQLTDPSQVRYASVSHCWGTIPFLTLTPENYQSFKDAIPLNNPDFSRKFRDVFHVVFDLGYSYVWIDSLCIIQHDISDRDWVEQCPLMAYIYKNADINISVAGPMDQAGVLEITEHSEDSLPQISLPSGEIIYVMHGEHFKNQTKSSPLLERGWVTQEHLLSSRILYFTDHNISWKCLHGYGSATAFYEAIKSEPDVDDIRRELFAPTFQDIKSTEELNVRLRGNLSPISSCTSATNDLHLLKMWYNNLISSYVSTKLTRCHDRLPALSGVAAIFQHAIKSRYIAGHWEIFFLSSLCWRSMSSPPKGLEEEIAPSWSWASTSNPKEFPSPWSRLLPFVSTLVRVETELATLDIYGSVKSGFIVIEGPLYLIDINSPVKKAFGTHLPWFEMFPNIFAQFELAPDHLSKYFVTHHLGGSWHFGGNIHTEESDKSLTQFTLLPLTHDVENIVRGIVLSPVTDRPCTYRRIGSFKIWQLRHFIAPAPPVRGTFERMVYDMPGGNMKESRALGDRPELESRIVRELFDKLEKQTLTIL